MADTPTVIYKQLATDDYTVAQRAKIDLAMVYATLHGGGPYETEKSKDVQAFIDMMLPYVLGTTG